MPKQVPHNKGQSVLVDEDFAATIYTAKYFFVKSKMKKWMYDNPQATTKRKVEQSGYPGGYCTVPVGTAAVLVLWVCPGVLQGTVGTAGTVDESGYCTVPVGTAGYCGYCRYCTGQ